jgi:hypothetical protein
MSVTRDVPWSVSLSAALLLSLAASHTMGAQPPQQTSKEYVPIVETAARGALPTARVSALTFESATKTGTIPLEIMPMGFWKSGRALAAAEYSVFEFSLEAPSHTTAVGEPNVPAQTIELAVPANAEVAEVSLSPQLLKTVENVTLLPNQEPLPIGQFIQEKEKPALSSAVYAQTGAYPGRFYDPPTTGYQGSSKVVILRAYPAQFYPAQKKVEFFKLTGQIKLRADQVARGPAGRVDERALGTVLANAPDAQAWVEYERPVSADLRQEYESVVGQPPGPALPPPQRLYDCVIITADLFYAPAKELAGHHTAKGVRTLVVREKKIEAGVSGRDAADKIRNFIRAAYNLAKIKWVILFGDVCASDRCDVAMVPTRMVVDPSPYTGVDDGWIPADFYYSCLDGTWDANGNGRYGEAADQPDLMPEVSVGRIPVDNLDDAEKVVSAIVRYENAPPAPKGALVAANDLGWDGHEVTFKNTSVVPLLNACPCRPVTALYERDGTLSVSTFAAAVNAGVDFVQYFGHGSPTSTQLMNAAQVTSLLNATASFPVVFSLSCSTARYDCIESFGEAWTESGRASAYVGSTRVAYGSLDTGEGLDIRFIRNFCSQPRAGRALDLAKYQLFRDFGWNALTLKTILEFSLFGDPVMTHVK